MDAMEVELQKLKEVSETFNLQGPGIVRALIISVVQLVLAKLFLKYSRRRALARRGLKSILDVVPNHVAPGHPWISHHPEYLVLGFADDARSVRLHLCADLAFQGKLVRFIENFDEPRALQAFSPEKARAVVTIATIPGAKLFREGQSEGRRVRLPVFLCRRPVESEKMLISRSSAACSSKALS